MVGLVEHMTRLVIQRELKTDSSHIEQVLRDGLKLLPMGADNIRLFINPQDFDQMFELLRAQDTTLVERIEDEMYDFFILSRQNQEVLQTLLEAIPLSEWVVALKGAEPALVKAIQGAMPRRQMQQMEAQNRRQGPVPRSRVEQVRKEIMAIVREMATEGGLPVQLFREQTVE